MLPGVAGFLPRASTPGSQTFSSTGTSSFTVPLYTTMTIEIWGGGGSGGNAYNGGSCAEGGQGGSYARFTVPVGALAEGSVETVYVGAGGSPAVGDAGGRGGDYSQFGNSITAPGGRGGNGQRHGGAGGGSYSPTNPRPSVFIQDYVETGAYGGVCNGGTGGSATYAGGGGGGKTNNSGQGGGDGGSSVYGGNGGPGVPTAAGFPAANQPGGGGGAGFWDSLGSGAGQSGAGGAGMIRITWT